MIFGAGDLPVARLDALAFTQTMDKSVKWETLKINEERSNGPIQEDSITSAIILSKQEATK